MASDEDTTKPVGPLSSSPVEVAPLISLSSDLWSTPLGDSNSEQHKKVGQEVVKALQTSGFLLVRSDLMPSPLQQQALEDATQWLTSESNQNATNETTNNNNNSSMVIPHPTDPKKYVMLEAKHFEEKEENQLAKLAPTLQKYWDACETLKKAVLRAIGVGLELEHPDDLATWHSAGTHSAMRLLHYPPATPTTGNRCKAHSDYGTVTLLSTDGVSGLEIYLRGKWWPVPHVPGSVVVNIGSLLSDWTTTREGHCRPLLATVHRVAGPASEHSASDPQVLQQAMVQGRTSIAFFADPDDGTPLSSEQGMTMEEYIQWRSGGSDVDRSGVAFTSSEKEILAVGPKD